MILYKNVDICDLASIMERGILSIDECGNNNWEEGHGMKNDTSVVYLFKPLTRYNSFPESYGVALLEIDCDAKENQMMENDRHSNDYTEYVTQRVLPSEIKSVIIPKIFKPYIDIPDGIRVTWCDMKADYYNGFELENCNAKVIEKFAKSAKLMDSRSFNFFRGFDERRMCIDLSNIEYVF